LILKEEFPTSGTLHDIRGKQDLLHVLYPKVEGFRLNYVVSPEVVEADSDLVSNELDRVLLRHIRSQSDLIITTGKTARLENLKSSAYAPMLILTNSESDLDFQALQLESKHPIYLTQKLGTVYPNSRALAIGINNAPISEFVASFFHANGFTRTVIETGKTIASEFAQSKLLTEINLTVTMVEGLIDAENAARRFLIEIGIGGLPTTQILNHEETWLFRFDAR
jgi:hypothetical protein